MRALAGSGNEIAAVLDYFEKADFRDWETRAGALGKSWRDGMKSVAANWNRFDDVQRFAVLQQAGSLLRSSLVNDLESRVR